MLICAGVYSQVCLSSGSHMIGNVCPATETETETHTHRCSLVRCFSCIAELIICLCIFNVLLDRMLFDLHTFIAVDCDKDFEMNSVVTKYTCNSHCCANDWGVFEEAPSSAESATHHCTFPYSENEKTN